MENWQPGQDEREMGEGALIRKKGKWKKAVYSTVGHYIEKLG